MLLIQSTPPSPTPVCPGSKLVFTCSTTRSNLFLGIGRSDRVYVVTNTSNPGTIFDSFYVTTAQVGNTLECNATNESVPVQLDGTIINCSDDFGSSINTTIVNIAGILLIILYVF